jgi:hypothetical protein
VLKGLGRSFQKIAEFLGLMGLIGLVGLIVAFPLWYFASNYTTGYTIFVAAALAAALLAVLIGRFVRLSREPGALRVFVKQKLLPILKKTAVVVASVAVVYGIAILISRGQAVAAILSAVAWLLLLGLFKYGRRGKR